MKLSGHAVADHEKLGLSRLVLIQGPGNDLAPCHQAAHHLVSPHDDGDDEYGDKEEDDVDVD